MQNRDVKYNYLKYIAIALVIVFFVTVALLLIQEWDRRQGHFPASGNGNGVVTYNGNEYVLKDNIETFLLLGLDKYEGTDSADSHESGIQADFLMLFVFDNKTNQSTAIHINRDTITKINRLSVGGSTVVGSVQKQIALAYNYANTDNDKIRCRNTKDSVEHLLNGMKVNHYLSVTMDAIPASCDLVGGVEVTVLDDFTGIDDTLIKGETVTLTGEQALCYVRARKGLEDSSNTARMARQQQYINALYEKVHARMAADEEFVIELATTMDQYVVYDSSNQKMQKIAEKLGEYEFLGIRDIEGETRYGDEFVEFHADTDSIWQIVIDLFYTPQESDM